MIVYSDPGMNSLRGCLYNEEKCIFREIYVLRLLAQLQSVLFVTSPLSRDGYRRFDEAC